MVHVPVHGESVLAEELQAVHADVVGLGFGFVSIVGVDGVDACEGDESPLVCRVPGFIVDVGMPEVGHRIVDAWWVPHCFEIAIEGPALEDGECREVDVVAGVDDLLAWGGLAGSFGGDLEQGEELLGFVEGFGDRAGRFGLDELGDGVGDVVKGAMPECHFHAVV